MALTEKERNTELKELLTNGWKMTDGRDAIEKTFLFKVSGHPCIDINIKNNPEIEVNFSLS